MCLIESRSVLPALPVLPLRCGNGTRHMPVLSGEGKAVMGSWSMLVMRIYVGLCSPHHTFIIINIYIYLFIYIYTYIYYIYIL